MRAILGLLISMFYLMGNTLGKGGGGDVPQYHEDPQTTQLKNQLYGQVSGILGTPYETLVNRFTPSAGTQGLIDQSINNYKGLIDGTDYSTNDYSKIQGDYLDQVLSRYDQSRENDFAPIRESLIANNLEGSGPGYDIMRKYADESSMGTKDIATSWAYNNINTQLQQQQYKDALQRGDYTAMYNLALSKANQEVAPQLQATQTQFAGAGAGSSLLGQMNAEDMTKYQAALSAYQAQQKGGKNLGGVGTALGLGLGALFAAPTGGLSMLAGSAIGGGIGGGLGSMFQY